MKKLFRENWIYLLGGILVLVLFSLRFYHLTILPVFADEAIYIRWAQIMKAEETLRFLPLSDGKEPLFMWVMIPFLKVFRDPLVAGRMLSVFSGFGTLTGAVFLSWLLFKSKNVSLASGFIYALIPFAFFFDRLSLVDSMLSMFGIWTFIFGYLTVKTVRLDYAMLAGFALGGAWLTKSPALFFALMLPGVWLFINPHSKEENHVRKGLKLFNSTTLTAISVIIGYFFYNILRLGPNYSMISARNLDYVYPLTHLLTSPFDPLKPFLLQSWQWLFMMATIWLVVLWLYGSITNIKKHWKQVLLLNTWFLLPILIESEFAKVLTARYIFFTLPYLIILSASSFMNLNNSYKNIILIMFILFMGKSMVFNYYLITNPEMANLPRSERSGYLEEWTAGQGIKESANYLIKEQIEHPDEKIVIGTEGYFGTLPDGLQMYLNYEKPITVIGVGLNFSQLPAQLIESKNSGNKTYLLINNERFKGDPAKLGLKLVAEYPKAERPDGSHQSLLFYELTKTSKDL